MKKKLVILLLSTFILTITACGQNDSLPAGEVTDTQWQAKESIGININNEKALKITFDNGMPIYIDSDSDWILSDILTVDGSKAIIKKKDTNSLDISFQVYDTNGESSYIDGTIYNYAMNIEESSIIESNGYWILVQSENVPYRAIYDDGNIAFTVTGDSYTELGLCDISHVFKALQTLIYPGNDVVSSFNYDTLVIKEIKGKMTLESKFKDTLLLEDFKKESGLNLEKTQDISTNEVSETGVTIISDEVKNTINKIYDNGTSITINLNTDSDYISSIFVAPYDSSLNLLNIDNEKIENMTLKTLYETIGIPDDYHISGVYGEYAVSCIWDNVTFFFNDKGENIGYILNLNQVRNNMIISNLD